MLRRLRDASVAGAAALAMSATITGQTSYNLPREGDYKRGDITCTVVHRNGDFTLVATGEPVRLQTVCNSTEIRGIKNYVITAFNGKPRSVLIDYDNGGKRQFEVSYTTEERRRVNEQIRRHGFDSEVVEHDSVGASEALQIFRKMEAVINGAQNE